MERPRLVGQPWRLRAGHPEQRETQDRLLPHGLGPATAAAARAQAEGGECPPSFTRSLCLTLLLPATTSPPPAQLLPAAALLAHLRRTRPLTTPRPPPGSAHTPAPRTAQGAVVCQWLGSCSPRRAHPASEKSAVEPGGARQGGPALRTPHRASPAQTSPRHFLPPVRTRRASWSPIPGPASSA